MAYVGLDGLLMSGINVVGVIGPKKRHPMYYNFNHSAISAAVRNIVSTCSRLSAVSRSTRSTARA